MIGQPLNYDVNQEAYIAKLLAYAKSLPEYGKMRSEAGKQYYSWEGIDEPLDNPGNP